jgi:PKHD-type hydroxylase
MMLHIPGVLSREQVASMRRRLDASNWVDGRTIVGAQGAQVKQNRQLAEGLAAGAGTGRGSAGGAGQ